MDGNGIELSQLLQNENAEKSCHRRDDRTEIELTKVVRMLLFLNILTCLCLLY